MARGELPWFRLWKKIAGGEERIKMFARETFDLTVDVSVAVADKDGPGRLRASFVDMEGRLVGIPRLRVVAKVKHD